MEGGPCILGFDTHPQPAKGVSPAHSRPASLPSDSPRASRGTLCSHAHGLQSTYRAWRLRPGHRLRLSQAQVFPTPRPGPTAWVPTSLLPRFPHTSSARRSPDLILQEPAAPTP